MRAHVLENLAGSHSLRPLLIGRRCTLLVLAYAFAAVVPAGAQRALGVGDDASTLPAGRLRLTLGGVWDRANERYTADGKLVPLGASASASPWNSAYDARLAAATPLVASLSGDRAFDASLGALAVGRRDNAADARFGADAGIMSWLTVGIRAQVVSHGIIPNISINARRNEGTMGLNPAWSNVSARGRNSQLIAQFDSAIAQTARRITACQTAPTTTDCAPIIANVSAAQSLVVNATAFANALNSLYGGRKSTAGLPFVPIANGAAQLAIDQRTLGYRDQFTALGVTGIGTTGPAGATVLSPNDVNAILRDSLYGYLLRPIREVHAYGLGDVSAQIKARVFQTAGDDTASLRGFGVRQAVGATLRLSGGTTPEANEPLPAVTGSGGGRALIVQSFTDLFYGSRFSTSIVVGIEQPQAVSYAARIPSASGAAVGGVPFPVVPLAREVMLTRTPGSRVDVAVTPRLALSGNLWLAVGWAYAQQSADSWQVNALNAPSADASVASDAQTWAAATNWSEHRLVLGGTYSTVAAARAGRTRLAYDVTFQHEQTLGGSGWRVPHLGRDAVTVRWYRPLWGRR